mmetsp:Transcript_2304/g.5370  ORF Transcript_2304/g.5370 Transcript_2304/m.5370 type:complete len:206 (-) Transcript_2304:1051-1668(-)
MLRIRSASRWRPLTRVFLSADVLRNLLLLIALFIAAVIRVIFGILRQGAPRIDGTLARCFEWEHYADLGGLENWRHVGRRVKRVVSGVGACDRVPLVSLLGLGLLVLLLLLPSSSFPSSSALPPHHSAPPPLPLFPPPVPSPSHPHPLPVFLLLHHHFLLPLSLPPFSPLAHIPPSPCRTARPSSSPTSSATPASSSLSSGMAVH